MRAPQGSIKAFMAELQRRRVTRTLIGYGVVAFVVMQASELVVPGLGLPDWVFRAVIIAALAGFPVAAVLSWAFDVGSPPMEDEVETPPPSTAGAGIRVGVSVVVIVVTTFAGWRIFQRTPSTEAIDPAPTPTGPATSDVLAILPFENLSADPDDSYFADGLHDEIITQFTKQGVVGVIAREAVRPYRDSDLGVVGICSELGCRYALSARVQRAGEAVAVRASLVNASTGESLWGDSFDGTITDVAGVIRLQRQIAERVVQALGLELSPQETERIAAVPTTNAEAYDTYLRGRVAVSSGFNSGGLDRAEHWRRARDWFRQAVELDPSFALAWAELAMQDLRLHWWNWAPSDESIAEADEAIRRATELDPDLPQLRLARAQRYLYVDVDPRPAAAEARLAYRDLPGDSWARVLLAGAERRAGNLDELIRLFEAGAASDPGPGGSGEILTTLRAQRRWAEMWEVFERRAERISPLAADLGRVVYTVQQTGDTTGIRRTFDGIVETYGYGPLRSLWYVHRVMIRDYPGAIELLRDSNDRFHLQWGFEAKATHVAQVYAYMGFPDSATHYAEQAVKAYEEGKDAFVLGGWWHSAIAADLARLGRRDEALAHADSAMAFFQRDLWLLDFHRERRMRVLMILGDYEEALDEIEYLLGAEYFNSLTVGMLRWDPAFDPLREHRRFQALVGGG